jgi:phospholipid/cholesterol/gamma-HCH transport system substrate-binding protein
MFKGNNNFVVGLFVSISIAIFVGFVLWLTGRSGVEDMNQYSLMFHRDVTGLSVGGPVNYMGVNIGSVTGMQLVRNKDMNVRVDIEVYETTPVDSGTFASLAFQGITGVAIINLGSDPGHHDELAATPGHEFPVIPVRDVGFAALLSTAPQIMTKMNDLLTHADELLNEQNRAAIADTLLSLESIVSALAENRESIARLPSELEHTLAGIQATFDRLQGVIKGIEPDLASTMDNITTATENLASLTARLDNFMVENEAGLQRFVEEGLGEAPDLLRNAQQTLRQLEKLVKELQDRPSQLIHRVPDDTLEIDP